MYKRQNNGYIQVQDQSSILAGHVYSVKGDENIIDICAAPGGKTLHAADRLNAAEKSGIGNIISCDLTEQKVKLISDNIKRNGFRNISVVKNDALVYKKEWENTADIIIADLPCSGLGVIGKKCDIKYKKLPKAAFYILRGCFSFDKSWLYNDVLNRFTACLPVNAALINLMRN